MPTDAASAETAAPAAAAAAAAAGATPAPLVCLLGPTASGKTALSLALAEALDAEIISVDSALVYRGLDIGSAKPSAAERARVPHHLIDRVEPDDAYSAARFVEDALAAIADIRARSRRVVLCGGTMLYVKALFEGLAALPGADPALRQRLLERAATDGWPALHAELGARDPESAARLHPNDRQRVQRALEVVLLTGRPLSEWHARTAPAITGAKVLLALIPTERRWLHVRIARRLATMRRHGFDEEVRTLAERGLPAELPALRSVGYRQALEALAAGTFERAPDGGMPEWPARAEAATRQLAKRQLTWLRGMPGIVPIACDTLTFEAQLDLALVHCQPSPP